MKSFYRRGLIGLVALGWAASAAVAQDAAPALLPLPSVTAVDTSSQTAAYRAVQPSPALTLPGYTRGTGENTPQPPPPPAPAPSEFDEALHNSGWDDCGCESSRGRWFGVIGGLAMGRTRANPVGLTADSNNNANQLLNTQNAGPKWAGGGQVTVGYGFAGGGCGTSGNCGSCGCGGMGYLGPGLAFTYWGIGPTTGFSQVSDSNNNLSTLINLNAQGGPVMIGSRPASDFFDNSHQQRVTRDDRVNNFELNLLQGAWMVGRLQVAAIAGFRYFRFDERMAYGGAAAGSDFGDIGGTNEAFLAFRCTNNLYGGQLGALLNYNVTDRFGIFAIPKVGLYANQMNCRSMLFTGDGQLGFDIGSHKSDFACLAEIDSGFSYALTQNLRAIIGYRVVGVANVALADNQFLPSLADTNGFSQVKQNGSLILHGAFAGLGWVF
jgi:hypothetical protein